MHGFRFYISLSAKFSLKIMSSTFGFPRHFSKTSVALFPVGVKRNTEFDIYLINENPSNVHRETRIVFRVSC